MDDSEFKRDVIERINRAREDGTRLGEIERNCPEDIGMGTIIMMMNAKRFPMSVWEKVDRVLKKLGY